MRSLKQISARPALKNTQRINAEEIEMFRKNRALPFLSNAAGHSARCSGQFRRKYIHVAGGVVVLDALEMAYVGLSRLARSKQPLLCCEHLAVHLHTRTGPVHV